jgi:hypothetical protein
MTDRNTVVKLPYHIFAKVRVATECSLERMPASSTTESTTNTSFQTQPALTEAVRSVVKVPWPVNSWIVRPVNIADTHTVNQAKAKRGSRRSVPLQFPSKSWNSASNTFVG